MPLVQRGVLFGCVFLWGLISGCAHRDAPRVYPDLDHDTAKGRLAIVEVIASDYLPQFPECEDPDVLCMDPEPTWIKLRTLETLNGEALPRTFYAGTTSHYGKMTHHRRVRGPQLMLLLGEGDRIVMSRYARAPLAMDASRRFHLVLRNQGPFWLPCDLLALREPITDSTLAQGSAEPRARFDEMRPDDADTYFRIEDDFAYPRYSLPIGKLESQLAGETRQAKDYHCPRTQD